ncbi:MAG TPA: FAD-dependent monooxygenase, partial [Allocoleopsis sp.]
SINRNILAEHLCNEGIRRFPDQIQYYFGNRLENIDFENKIATFENAQSQIKQQFDLLIGADGVFSSTRELIIKQFSDFKCEQNRDDMTFKICQLGASTKFASSAADWGECFHTWPSTQPVTILAPPNPDGTLTGVLILPQQGDFTFEKIKNKEDVESLFFTKFPDVFADKYISDDFVQDLLEQKSSYGGITTNCSAFHVGDSVVLIGDAAHSVWASLGQGCNVALESCRIFAEILAQNQDNLQIALSAYTKARKPDTDAIGRMSEEGFGGNKRAGNALFFTKIIELSLLNKLLPILFKPPALFQINLPNVGYATIENQWQNQQKQLKLINVVVIVSAIALLIANNL